MVVVVLMVPVAFMHPPAFAVMIVVGMTPIGSGIRWLCPASRDPDIATIAVAPVSVGPDESRAWRRWAALVTDRGRS
jgi:hypothetical protein